jgi:SAM-dependent methyltransferase
MSTESELVARQYDAWVYPRPVSDIAQAVATGDYWDLSDPSLVRRKLWPRKIEPDNLSILIAGCGTFQAAYYAIANRDSHVVGIDISDASLGHQAYLKQKHQLDNLDLIHMSLEQIDSLGRSFDLIVCTGVLHHLPHPDAGLRCLRDVLRPHGVMSLMLYGYYPRVGVYMMQEAFRLLGVKQDAAGIDMVKYAIDALPQWHHLYRYRQFAAADLDYDSGLVDTFLHSVDQAFTVQRILQLAEENNLKFQSWLDNLDYSVSAWFKNPEDPIRRVAQTLPLVDQWRLIELIAQTQGNHRFLLCHPSKEQRNYTLDFTGDLWLDYIPSLRHSTKVSATTDGVDAALVDAANEPLVIRRHWQTLALGTFEAGLFEQADGERSIRDMLKTMPGGGNDTESLSAARQFFRCMADWDHLQYQIP